MDDGDGLIVKKGVGALTANRARTRFKYALRGTGLTKVVLKQLSQPGKFLLKASAKKWFSAAAANQPAGNTTLTVTIGNQCFSHIVTKKTE